MIGENSLYTQQKINKIIEAKSLWASPQGTS